MLIQIAVLKNKTKRGDLKLALGWERKKGGEEIANSNSPKSF